MINSFVISLIAINLFYFITSTTVSAETPKFVPGELIVKFKESNAKSLVLLNKLNSFGVAVKRKISLIDESLHVLKFENKRNIEEVLYALESFDEIEYAEPNYIYEIIKDNNETSGLDFLKRKDQGLVLNYTPNDPYYSRLWGMKKIDMSKAWQIERGSKKVRIAVIDTGIDYNHPDLRDQMWVNSSELNGTPGVDDDGNGYIDDVYGYDFANNDSDPIDGHSHGTHCAGTIGGAHNDLGVTGVMENVEFVALKFLTDKGSGTTEGAIRSIDYATKMNVDIMSNSWGGGGFSQALKDAIQRASDRGIIFTAAAGNSSSNNDVGNHYPSNYQVENVISVAATTKEDVLASFSSYGKRTVHIAAPGHEILSTVKEGRYKKFSGTSMATPHVSGALGLLISKEGRMPQSELKERLMTTSTPLNSLKGKIINHGRLNVYNLLTNTIPERNMPKPGEWVRRDLNQVFESSHPYRNNQILQRTIRIPGAKFIKVNIREFDLERRYDFLTILDSSGNETDKLTGRGQNYISSYTEGESVTIHFRSDRSIIRWGFVIDSVEVQY